MLRWRLLVGTLIVAALVGLFWLDAQPGLPGLPLVPVLLVFGLLATQEALDLAEAGGLRPLRWPVYCGNLLLFVSPWMPDSVVGWPSLAFALAVLLVFIGEICRYEKPGGVTANLGAAIFVMAYVGLLLTFAIKLRLESGLGALASLIIVVKAGDTGAYTVGRLIGRHKMSPKISPGKTIEGAIGALAFALFASWATFAYLGTSSGFSSSSPCVPCPSWGWIVYGLLVGAAGMIGDLAESLLKRDSGRKDSSRWLPGLGGVLDIVDSILLAAPVAYACWIFGLVGAAP